MSVWWDDDDKRYRSSLIYKVFYVWGWPILKFVLHRCMSAEQAHTLATHYGIRWIGNIDRIWQWCFVFPAVIVFLLFIRLLLFIPGFTCTPPPDDDAGE